MTKKYLKRAEADVGIIFTAYNLRRLISIIGVKALESYLRKVLTYIFVMATTLRLQMDQFKPGWDLNIIFGNYPITSRKTLYLPEIN